MAKVVYLVSRQDLEAFVDGESTYARGAAIQRRLEIDSADLNEVAALSRMNGDLRTVKPRLYKDRALQRALAVLFWQRPRPEPREVVRSH